MFVNRHVNRVTFPSRHILVCEDDIGQQIRIAQHLLHLFGGQGQVQISIVAGAAQAAGLMERVGVELILLDHDMPFGNGGDLLAWLAATGRQTPVITFSGIPSNNAAMMAAGANHRFDKDEVIAGAADEVILKILGVERQNHG